MYTVHWLAQASTSNVIETPDVGEQKNAEFTFVTISFI